MGYQFGGNENGALESRPELFPEIEPFPALLMSKELVRSEPQVQSAFMPSHINVNQPSFFQVENMENSASDWQHNTGTVLEFGSERVNDVNSTRAELTSFSASDNRGVNGPLTTFSNQLLPLHDSGYDYDSNMAGTNNILDSFMIRNSN